MPRGRERPASTTRVRQVLVCGNISKMKTIGLIGAGHIGSQIARLAVAHGYEVVISNSRGPETLSDLVNELGPHARAATVLEAAKAGTLRGALGSRSVADYLGPLWVKRHPAVLPAIEKLESLLLPGRRA